MCVYCAGKEKCGTDIPRLREGDIRKERGRKERKNEKQNHRHKEKTNGWIPHAGFQLRAGYEGETNNKTRQMH